MLKTYEIEENVGKQKAEKFWGQNYFKRECKLNSLDTQNQLNSKSTARLTAMCYSAAVTVIHTDR